MAKNSIPEWDTTANNNTDIGGTNIDEGCAPSGMNNAVRSVMKQIADLFGTAVTFSSGQKTQFQQNFDLEPGVDIPTYALTPTKLDVRRNRIVNHDMRMSQENGSGSGTSNGYYAADQWAQYFVTNAGSLAVQRVGLITPAGSPTRLRATVAVADASLAAGEYWTLSQNLEGSNVADFQYGSSAAKSSVLRFGFKGPAGTYAVALHNSAANRSFVALFTIAGGDANTDTVQTISIAGDQTGLWLKDDGVIGITLDIVLACGSTFQGTTGWQAGNILGTSGVSNGMGTGGAVFELFDVGLRLDPGATGVYGQYEVGEVDAVYRSERYGYFWGASSGSSMEFLHGQCPTASLFTGLYVLPAPMPANMTITGASGGNYRIYAAGFGYVLTTNLSLNSVASDRRTITISASTAGPLTPGWAAALINGSGNVPRIGILARLS